MLLVCLNVAHADFGNAAIGDNGAERAFQSTNGNDRWAKGGPLHLLRSSADDSRESGLGTACDAPNGGPHRHSRHSRLSVGLPKKF
jgi:hypothetical protein